MSALHKVLVVDDDPVVGRSFDRVLSGKGYAVITAASGQEALDKLETENYDLVFTDIKMPGMSGLDMAEQVKQRRPWLPVVIVTGYGSPGNEARAAAAGVSGFLRKPLSPEMIEDSAQKALSEKSAAEQSADAAPAVIAPAAVPAQSRVQNVARVVKNIALFLAAPFIGLAYILAFPIVGLVMLAGMALQAQKKKSEEAAKLEPTAPAKSSFVKSTAIFLAAPFIGLAFIIAGPIVGLVMLLWFGFQAWGKLGAKAIAEHSDAE
ncbi:MAG: response regulator [Burkholderiales bacterium]|nr:response regulator [Burkholderiales bacterium]